MRTVGIDFAEGETLVAAGTRLTPRALALAAAANRPELQVRRRPRVAILATGDELVAPGQEIGPAQIVASNNYFIAGLVRAAGGEVLDLGIAIDDHAALADKIEAARRGKADVLVTLGGASVGDYDLVQKALTDAGMELGFWKIAMRPGKPLMHGRIAGMQVLGLPGNPTSSAVCGVLFLRPLVRALLGEPNPGADASRPARLATPLPANGIRQDYLRASLSLDEIWRLASYANARSGLIARQDLGLRGRPDRARARRRDRRRRRPVSGHPIRPSRRLTGIQASASENFRFTRSMSSAATRTFSSMRPSSRSLRCITSVCSYSQCNPARRRCRD